MEDRPMRRFLLGLAALTLVAGRTSLLCADDGSGGQVLAATDTPYGYSLQDMAAELAYFSTSGNDPKYYPDTPFQILYDKHGNGPNTFYATPDTPFFVPVAWVDDGP